MKRLHTRIFIAKQQNWTDQRLVNSHDRRCVDGQIFMSGIRAVRSTRKTHLALAKHL